MTVLEALILGVVQGITEFLPVSSSGHLVLLQKIFGIGEPALLFDILVHTATLIAVCVVLWKDIWDILKKIIQPLTLYIIIATIPAVIAALVFRKQINGVFSSTSLLGFFFLVTSALLVCSELFSRKAAKTAADNKTAVTEKKMKWLDALIIGIFQAVAIVPGISRSGATLSAGLFRGLKRDFAVRFAFLLSIPAILGALVLQVKDIGKITESIGALPLAVGFIAAAVTGFFSVKIMLKIVRERSLFGFAVYTCVLGLIVIIDSFGTHFFL
ncbi:MAG: undecaprenyl-diphosphate phosphatase [Treponema sp.]|nr:undecaprenyl-diphosphate phosphatase [Treponema sp.]